MLVLSVCDQYFISNFNPPASGLWSYVDGYMVQKYWSQTDNTSIAPGGTDYQALTQVPVTLNSAHFTLTSLQQGAKTSAELQFSYVTLSATPGQATFDGFWKGASGKLESVVGSLVTSGRTLQVTVTRQSDGQVLFTGSLS